MKNKQLVSIILPVLNNQNFLEDALLSLKKQTYKNIEIIAIDDKSTDKSYKILKQWKKKDKRIKVYKNKKRYGLAISLNRALRRSKGDFIAFADPCDISATSRIKKQLLSLLADPKLVALSTQCRFYSEKNKALGKSIFPNNHETIVKSILSGTSLQFEAAMIARQRLPKDILRFEKKAYPLLFSELFLKISSYGLISNLPIFLYRRRILRNQAQNLQLLASRAILWLQSAVEYGTRPSLSSLFASTRINTNSAS